MELTNKENAELTRMIGIGVEFELGHCEGGQLCVEYLDYSFFIPELQKAFAKVDDLRDYDGVHQYDFDGYVGVGY